MNESLPYGSLETHSTHSEGESTLLIPSCGEKSFDDTKDVTMAFPRMDSVVKHTLVPELLTCQHM